MNIFEEGINLGDLHRLVARKNKVEESMVFTFSDYTDTLTELLKMCDNGSTTLIGAGLVSPEVSIAADRANLKETEIVGDSPFATDVDNILSNIRSSSEIVYLANPNRITGANFSVAEIQEIALKLETGYLIVDEFYHDYFGITATKLLAHHDNIIILRSFAAAFSINSSDIGFLIASETLLKKISESIRVKDLSLIKRKSVANSMMNDEPLNYRLNEVNDESFRLATTLTRLGAQTRILATDSILIRVADPAQVGNFLSSMKVEIENLDGYPKLKNYIKYQILSPLTNDVLVKAFEKMPNQYYQMKSIDSTKTVLRNRGEEIDITRNSFSKRENVTASKEISTNRRVSEKELTTK